MTKLDIWCAAVVLALPLLGCDGQQYVSPDTVALSITDDATNTERVGHCDYVPVLLGSAVENHYVVDSDLEATLSITRAAIRLTFSGAAASGQPFQVTPKDLVIEESLSADDPPAGYSVTLTAHCTPGD